MPGDWDVRVFVPRWRVDVRCGGDCCVDVEQEVFLFSRVFSSAGISTSIVSSKRALAASCSSFFSGVVICGCRVSG